MRLKKRYLLPLIVSVGLTLAVPFWLSGLDGYRRIANLPGWAVGSLVVLLLASWGVNTVRIRMLVHALDGRVSGLIDAALIVMSAEFAGAATPAGAGMPATYALLFGNLGLRFGPAMGLIAAIVVLDVAYFVVMMALAGAGLVVTASARASGPVLAAAAAIVAGAAALIWVMARYYRPMLLISGRLLTRIPWIERRRFRLGRTTVEFIRAMRLLRGMPVRKLLVLSVLTAGVWLPRYAILVLAVFLVSPVVPVAYLLLVQGLLNLGGQAVILPGGGGGVDAAYAALTRWFLDPQGIAFTLLVWRACSFYWNLLVGAPVFLLKTGTAAQRLLGRRS